MEYKRNWKNKSDEFRKRVLLNKANKRWRRKHRKKRQSQQTRSEVKEQIRMATLRKAFPDFDFITAPQNFSLSENEEKTLVFLRKIKTCYENGTKVLIRLDKVKKITNDAILLLMSTMVQFQTANIRFDGTRPDKKAIEKKIDRSGFYNYVSGKTIVESDQYSFNRMESHLYTHGQKRVDSNLANEIVKYSSTFVWGEPRRCQGVQKTLLELMHNTFDHADRQKGEKHWWLSVEQNKKRQEVTFAFIDFGVGIFRSLKNKKPNEPLYGALDSLKSRFPNYKTEPELLQLILEGKIKRTQSKKYNRGKGLSKIHTLYRENKISSLVMVSNKASAHPDNNDFHELADEFMGTFISFKINQNTVSLPWIA